ncbi:unnamed protein product [Phytomonas sp. EM1]|nr:unnamed protein product [Phytomonas sp. EM1]|eukprot:CCW60334.1 unnamed protein product [Phytomonas sp. isolate EM1]
MILRKGESFCVNGKVLLQSLTYGKFIFHSRKFFGYFSFSRILLGLHGHIRLGSAHWEKEM